MTTPKPTLYVFAISHYCEVAKWALDWHGISYHLVHWAPGQHIAMGKKLGATNSSVPKLSVGDQLIEGTADIIRWADSLNQDQSKSLTPDNLSQDLQDVEARALKTIGVYVRKLYYAEALNNHPEQVLPILIKNVPFLRSLLVRIVWPKIRRVMISRMGTTLESCTQSVDILESEFDHLEEILADGRLYLAGDQFSRVDMAVAGLLAPIFQPQECAQYKGMFIPPQLKERLSEWNQRPIAGWVREIYKKHRQ